MTPLVADGPQGGRADCGHLVEVRRRAARHGPLLIAGYLRPWAERIVDLVQPRPGALAVDVVCDSGVATEALARRGAVAIGVDSPDPGADVSGLPVPRGATVQCMADGLLPFPDDAADVVTSLFTVGLAPGPRTIAAEMRRVLGPTGRAAIALWSASASVERVLADSLRAFGIRSPFLDGLLDPALGDTSWLDERVLRDVARFDGVDHFWTAMVVERPLLGGFECGLDHRVDIKRHCAARLARHTAADGTMRIPVEVRCLTAGGDDRS